MFSKFTTIAILATTVSTVLAQSSASSCTPYSATGCPAVSNSCCAFICGEAQVPFPVCQPTDGTGEFASCSACGVSTGSMTSAPSSTTTESSASVTDVTSYTTTSAATLSSASESTCSPYSATGCPAISNSCCNYICGEAQVPFALCYSTDNTGEFASCSKCGTAGPTSAPTTSAESHSSTTPTSYTAPVITGTTNASVPVPVPEPTTALPAPTYVASGNTLVGSAAMAIVLTLVGMVAML